MAEVLKAAKVRHRTHPIPGTLTPVPGYPKKLTLYKIDASPYWWVRYYAEGKIFRRSTKTEIKRDAIAAAKRFFADIASRQINGTLDTKPTTFSAISEAMLNAMDARVARRDLTKETKTISAYRLRKEIIPKLGEREITNIHYEDLEKLLDSLSRQTPKLSPSTISSYMKLVRQVFNYAYKRREIINIPHFPTVGSKHQPRGYFTVREYRQMWSRARKLIGERFEYRVLKDAQGNEIKGKFFPEGESKEGRLIRKTAITRELVELIVFSANSYVRPTDIKNLQHKHVTVVRGERTYLRLNPPETKGHGEPFVTMKMAVDVYERLTAYNQSLGRDVSKEAYVFYPNFTKRDYALKELERQFAILMWNLDLGRGPKGEERTMYSLRHTCFMYRLMYGEKIDLITLARNGRTSPEMINEHYASQLQGEDNIDMLQSRRRKGRRTSVN